MRKDLALSLTYGSANSRVTENGNAALIGKRVAGVPRSMTTATAAWTPVPNWTASLTWRRVGRYAVNADNSLHDGGYATVDLGLRYRASGARPDELHATLANAADKAYATSVSVIGGMPLFAPGAPRTLKLGARFSF